MAPTRRVKDGRKPSATDREQKVKIKRKKKVAVAPPSQPAAEPVKPISKHKEWKLLYAPYPFRSEEKKPSGMKGSGVRSNSEAEDSGEYKGLCKNCRKQKSCRLPKPEGGVWRCEDYE